MQVEACKGAFSKRILEKAERDRDIVVVCTDSKGSASLGRYSEELPKQFVELGIAEQNAVTVASGMASLGKKVFVVGPASFYSMRAAEQIKIDMAYSCNGVKVIGISGGISYGALGSTHHSLQDVALMRAIPDLIVEIPADANQMRALTDVLLETDEPAYVRIGREGVPVVYPEDVKAEIGKAVTLCKGTDVAVIACGQLVSEALEAARLLKEEGVCAMVIDMHTIKPLDKHAVLEAACSCGCVLTAEEHSIHGGLGAAVAEVLSQEYPVLMEIAAIPDENIPNGKAADVFRYYHLDAASLAERAKALIAKKESWRRTKG